MFDIEKNIPVPISKGRTRYPFSKMEVGDSIFITDKKIKQSVYNSACIYGRGHKGEKFSVRSDETGFRIWRIK